MGCDFEKTIKPNGVISKPFGEGCVKGSRIVARVFVYLLQLDFGAVFPFTDSLVKI